MDWKYLFTSFEGRINRQPFWIGFLIVFFINILVGSASGFSINPFGMGGMGGIGGLGFIISLLLIYPALAIGTKRCHDRNKSGWWQLLMVIPFVGFIWFVIDLGILEGTDGDNQYGPNPL